MPQKPCTRVTHVLDTTRIKVHTGTVARQELYLISMAARELGMHPQTLRKYERLGLVRPTRTMGSMRVYSGEELERLRLIKHLVDELGINLAGVQRLLTVAESVERMRSLAREERHDRRRLLFQELDRLSEMLGL
ncbi:MAG: MerR family transcriptional regulator [Acidobacteria bacterium]|nr:MerR family transcriptional regulator [Acidobacteriota bacterium]